MIGPCIVTPPGRLTGRRPDASGVTGVELEDDIVTTAASVAADSDRLKQIEIEKTALPLTDPRMSVLAAEAARLGDRIAATTHAQAELVEQAAEEGAS